MRAVRILVTAAFVYLFPGPLAESAADSRLGMGPHYWRLMDAVGDRAIERDGMSWHLSYQRSITPLWKWQADLEAFPQDFAGSEKEVFAPQVFAVAGDRIYGAVGAGMLYSNGRFSRRPFYNVRAGLDVKLMPRTRMDLHVNYQFSEWGSINRADRDFESDVLVFGFAVRMVF